MKMQTVIIALAAALFVFPAGAQTTAPGEPEAESIVDDYIKFNSELIELRRRFDGSESADEVDITAERAYLYAAFCEGNKSSYRKQVSELLFTRILVDLGGRQFNQIAPRKSIDKIRNIID